MPSCSRKVSCEAAELVSESLADDHRRVGSRCPAVNVHFATCNEEIYAGAERWNDAVVCAAELFRADLLGF